MGGVAPGPSSAGRVFHADQAPALSLSLMGVPACRARQTRVGVRRRVKKVDDDDDAAAGGTPHGPETNKQTKGGVKNGA